MRRCAVARSEMNFGIHALLAIASCAFIVGTIRRIDPV
jgi:hypothetical protein